MRALFGQNNGQIIRKVRFNSSMQHNRRVQPDEARLVEFTSELIAHRSIGGSPGENAIQTHLAQQARGRGWQVHTWDIPVAHMMSRRDFPGMEVERTQACGVIVRIPGTGGGRTLLFDGHTDVVPPGDLGAWSQDPFTPTRTIVNGRPALVGRGACDMLGGLAAAWEAICMVTEARTPLRGDIVLAPVSAEEDGGLGTYALIDELRSLEIHPDSCIVPEPTNLDLVPANGGALTFRLIVPGTAVHASRRTEGVSAIDKFLPLHAALIDLERDRNAHVDPLMERWPIAYPISLGTVTAGDWASTVPDRLIANGRYGVALDEDITTARLRLEEAVAAACADDPWLRDHPATVEWWGGQFASGRTDPDSEIVQLLSRTSKAHTNKLPEIYGGPYGSDLRLLTELGGIPTVQYGPGDTSYAHAPDEHVVIEDLVTCASVLADVIVEYVG
jgi:acetylornithine deacetylase